MGSGMTPGGTPANTSLGRFDQVDYMRGADTSPGTLVQVGTMIGLDTQGGPSGSHGSLMIEGGIQVPNPDSVAVSAGAAVGYDFANQKVASPGDANIGLAVTASSGTNPIAVKLVPVLP